ncbi:hypothetical protein TNCV_1508321 [Trichonephila clavipes]|nr:hypothetical protein TNCV_1508321 [Trichonephila clavipes]
MLEQLFRLGAQSKVKLPVFNPKASLVLISQPIERMKGGVDLPSSRIEPRTCVVEALYATTRPPCLNVYFKVLNNIKFGFVYRALIMIDKAWGAATPLTIHSCFKKSGFPSPNLVDVDDTLTEFNAEPSLWEALPEQDLTFDDYVLVDTDIAVWGALSDAEIVALDHNNTERDEDESEELTPITLSESKVSLNKLRNFFLQNHVDADILQDSFVLEKSIDKVRLNALTQKR